MHREQAINIIERTFPADASSPLTAITGQRLLQQAHLEGPDWRALPTPVLQRYATLCAEEAAKLEQQHQLSQR